MRVVMVEEGKQICFTCHTELDPVTWHCRCDQPVDDEDEDEEKK